MGTRADVLTEFKVGNRTILRDEPGYLIEFNDWDEEIAEIIAAEEGVVLEDDHWAIIRYLREEREKNGISVDARFVFKFLAKHKGMDKKEARRYFFKLFPYGYAKQPVKIAGLPQPRVWSTG